MKKLTAGQREVLTSLNNGAILVLNQNNMAYLVMPDSEPKMISHVVRMALTGDRLVERADKTKDIKAKGNGFVISDKGRAALLT